MTKPMLPTLTFEKPSGENWVFEIKYDGYRGTLFVDISAIYLKSRNKNNLNDQFPEIIDFCLEKFEVLKPYLPLLFDGEVCVLESPYKASFEKIQQRGRLKSKTSISNTIQKMPAHFLVFDLLMIQGKSITNLSFQERKQQLAKLFSELSFPLYVDENIENKLQYIPFQTDFELIWRKVKQHDSEGIIIKNRSSKWKAGKRTNDWLKLKNWKIGAFIITGLDLANYYFHIAVIRNGALFPIGLFTHGLNPDEREALIQTIKNNKIDEKNKFIRVKPGICVELKFLELYKDEVRQPIFSKFLFQKNWEECTWERLQKSIKPLPQTITITHPEKLLWKGIVKQDYIDYLMSISTYFLPFLKNRLLTVIRYPHGMFGEKFYQKNCPDYAPEWIKTVMHEGIRYVLCNEIETLVWLGNQLSFEFHIPFETIYSKGPSEIVFDLDPPSRSEISLAISAALMLKEVFDNLKLQSFVKTSGNKGLQIYIPLPENTYTYDDTRLFTSFIAHYLVSKDPNLFTIERLKKNRGNKLYIDYVQHAKGKTIIAPYSVRGNEGAYVATPLFWEEVTSDLSIEEFPIDVIVKRLDTRGCPFKEYFNVKNKQPFQPVLTFIKNQKGRD